METVTVKIGKFSLTLAPLEQKDIASAQAVALRLKATYKRQMSDEWLAACRDALTLVFLSARKADPDLSLADLCDEATPTDAFFALRTVSEVTLENALQGEKPNA